MNAIIMPTIVNGKRCYRIYINQQLIKTFKQLHNAKRYLKNIQITREDLPTATGE